MRIAIHILLWFMMICTNILHAQYSNIKTVNINTTHGLPGSTVNTFLHDNQRFMWLGTNDGLARYDGYQFKTYKHNPFDSVSLSSNHITALYESLDSNIWIGTQDGGINIYNAQNDNFFLPKSKKIREIKNIYDITGNKKGLIYIATNKGITVLKMDSKTELPVFPEYDTVFNYVLKQPVLDIEIDNDSVIWIGTKSNGLLKYNRLKRTFKHFNNTKNNRYQIPSNTVYAIKSYNDFTFIGTKNGLCIYNKTTDSISIYNKTNGLLENAISAIFYDNKSVWVGYPKNGFSRLFLNTKNISHYLTGKQVNNFYKNKNKLLWIATDNGVYKTNIFIKKFYHFYSKANDNTTLNSNYVSQIFIDRSSNIWFGTLYGGLSKLCTQTDKTTHYKHVNDAPKTLSNNNIYYITEDAKGKIWIVNDHGINHYYKNTNEFVKFKIRIDGKLIHDISALLFDYWGFLWIGTKSNGLYRYNFKNNSIIQYKHNKNTNSLPSNSISFLYEDKRNNLWIGTSNSGFCKYNRIKNNFTTYKKSSNNLNSISGNKITYITDDHTGDIWIGTKTSGVNKFDMISNKFVHYTEKNGLTNNYIKSIIEDRNGNIWIATENGLSYLNRITEQFVNYYESDGLQSNQFTSSAAITGNGFIILGGINGFNTFHPDSIEYNAQPPKVVITDIKKQNKSIDFKQPIHNVKEITLAYNEYEFTIEFAALDFYNPSKNKYAYRLENFNSDWINAGTNRTATYTNLPPGEYIFHVTACNNDGVWNYQGSSLKVIIEPPFWKTTWFYTLSIVFVISVLFFIVYMRERSIQKSKILLTQTVDKKTKELVLQKNDIMIQKEEIQNQRDRILKQKDKLERKQLTLEFALEKVEQKKVEVEAKNKEITDSIIYAKRIQESVLPPNNFVKEIFPNSFIYYKPKDILSGDFYWIEQFPASSMSDLLQTQNPEYVLAAAVDCTGHGVPGALMSIVGNNLLNHALKEFGYFKPADILNSLNANLNKTVHKTLDKKEVKDGMDISLISIHQKTKTVYFSGANNPLYLVRNGELSIIKGDRASIGQYTEQDKQFNNHIHKLQPNDMLYLFSDGYPDQFGGETAAIRRNGGKKYKYNRFKKLLTSISHLPLDKQKIVLDETIKKWMGGLEQVDDILIIGIRI